MLEKMMESYKILIIIPIILALLSVSIVAFNGLEQSVDLKGGSLAELQLSDSISQSDLENQLSNALHTENIKVTGNGNNKVTVELENNINSSTFNTAINGKAKVISYNEIGPVLSDEAMGQIYIAMIFAFIFMAITVFILFKEFVPSIAIILAAACDIAVALGGMSLFHIPLSIASVGALLMIIGYSVDTDILLTTRLLKRREGTVVERAKNAMETGLTMSIAAIVAMGILYLVTVTIMPEATTLSNISAVLVMGLIGDIISTWLMNLGILRSYINWKHDKKQAKYNIISSNKSDSKKDNHSKKSDSKKDNSDKSSNKNSEKDSKKETTKKSNKKHKSKRKNKKNRKKGGK